MEGDHNNYLTELVLKQRGNRLEGVFGYYFKDTYQSFYIHGSFDKDTREVNIKNIPLTYFLATKTNDIECPMSFHGTLLVSKVKAVLSGYFYSDSKYKYTCPQLRVSMKLDLQEKDDSVLNNVTTGQKIWKPHDEDIVVTAKPAQKPAAPAPDSAKKSVVVNNTTPQKPDTAVNTSTPATASATTTTTTTTAVPPRADTPTAKSSAPAGISISSVSGDSTKRVASAQLNEQTHKKLVTDFAKRKAAYSKDLEIEGDSLRVSFYDNGEIDGDSISVFLNKQPIVVNQEITERALTVYLALDSTKEVNEISMFANNLGKIPPNTALMVLTDGKNRYEVFLSSSFTQNATVRLRKKKM